MLHLRADNLSNLPGVAHGFFGRSGGASTGIFASLNCGPGSGDEREKVIENRCRTLRALTESPRAQLLTLYQIHSSAAVIVTEAWDFGNRPQADAMVTNVSGIALGILTADCAPVLLADAEANVIGAAHAGWKGAVTGVIASAVSAMEQLGAERRHMTAAIGPCISQNNYEIGEKLRDMFLAANPANAAFFLPSNRGGHWRFDLQAFVARQLKQLDVKSVERISGCTYAQEKDFFSFRRATHRGEKDYGRQLSAILLK